MKVTQYMRGFLNIWRGASTNELTCVASTPAWGPNTAFTGAVTAALSPRLTTLSSLSLLPRKEYNNRGSHEAPPPHKSIPRVEPSIERGRANRSGATLVRRCYAVSRLQPPGERRGRRRRRRRGDAVSAGVTAEVAEDPPEGGEGRRRG